MSEARERTRVLVEIGLVIALAYVLGFLKLWQMPQGGEVSFAMLPLVVLALRRGLKVGLVGGLLYGLVDLMHPPLYIVHWVQFFLDYPLAYMAVGLTGAFAGVWRTRSARGAWAAAVALAVVPGIALGATARFAFHFVSGVVYFSEYAGNQAVWLYSAGYNSVVFVSAALCGVAAALVLPALERIVPTSRELR